MYCQHVKNFVVPIHLPPIYKEDCAFCFQTSIKNQGLNICLTCGDAFCHGNDSQNHSIYHKSRKGHGLFLNYRCVESVVPPAKITKVAVAAQERKEIKTKLVCLECDGCWDTPPQELQSWVDDVVNAVSVKQKNEIKEWEETVVECEHTLCLEQAVETNLGSCCAKCDLTKNLWLCLVCGHIGCGRRQYDGLGGNEHGMEHFNETGHLVVVKLGTIGQGEGDVFCYSCGEMRLDPQLNLHLVTLGLNVETLHKTDKSMAELQLEQNQKFDFSMTTVDGVEFEPFCKTGIMNLGNSCYMASVVQCLFALESVSGYYCNHVCDEPRRCFKCQMTKMNNGLKSQRSDILPISFKEMVGQGEFATMKQQDAFEFLLHLIKLIKQKDPQSPIVDEITFTLKQRLECQGCHRVKISTNNDHSVSLPLNNSLPQSFEAYCAGVPVTFSCPLCSCKEFLKSYSFDSFPKVLVVQMERFGYANWLPIKINDKVAVPLQLDLTAFASMAETNEVIPEKEANRETVQSLLDMGFPLSKCEKAALETANVEEAMNWIFAHMDDAECDKECDHESIAILESMGFSAARATLALKETSNNVERALDWLCSHPEQEQIINDSKCKIINDSKYNLVSFISHKGTSTFCGHYVAHVLVDGKWLIFNDSRVAIDPNPPFEDAYIYIYSAN